MASCSKFTGSKVPLYEADTIAYDSTRTVLVAYFSRSGNTQCVAEAIARQTGGTLFRIERATPYPDGFRECADEAKEERDGNIRPALARKVEDFDRYDVIFVGCPVWWHTAPMPVWSFLENEGYDFFRQDSHSVLFIRQYVSRRDFAENGGTDPKCHPSSGIPGKRKQYCRNRRMAA